MRGKEKLREKKKKCDLMASNGRCDNKQKRKSLMWNRAVRWGREQPVQKGGEKKKEEEKAANEEGKKTRLKFVKDPVKCCYRSEIRRN